MNLLLLILFSSLFTRCLCNVFTIPEATLEFLSPKGLRMSIPATDPDVTLVAFHVNLNTEFYGVEHGHWAEDILKTQQGRWVYEIQDLRVRPGDTVYYWVYAIRNGLGFQNVNRSFKVSGDPNPQSSTSESPVDWKSGQKLKKVFNIKHFVKKRI